MANLGFLGKLFDTSDFPPRWHCGEWSAAHGWLHIISDLAIFAAYFAIPVVLLWFVRRRRDVPFPPVFWLFALFILACGLGHLVEATIFWHPWYRLSGAVKLATAVVSWVTVISLIKITPLALRLPGLATLNRELETHVVKLQRKEAELERSNRELDSFAHVASHDLKAPLRAIDHLSLWIEEDARDTISDEAKGHLVKLRGRVRRMERLLDDLLEYSRVGRGLDDVEEVDVERLVRDVAELVGEEGFTVDVQIDLPPVKTVRAPLEIVFRNLINNAIKHHDGDRGQVGVSAELKDDALLCTVSDDGPGISAEYREKVFQLFRTLRPRDEIEGSGIGLSIVRKTVESAGGHAWIEAREPRGSICRFTWPVEAVAECTTRAT